MREFWLALTVFVLLCFSASVGMYVRPRLPPVHHTHGTDEMMQLVIGMLVTFAALVLGLLTASVKAAYDEAAHSRQQYALQLTQLDRCLHNYGPGSEAARADIRSYTAAVIASTWPSEPAPAGVPYPDTSGMPLVGPTPVLTDLMNRVGLEIDQLNATDPVRVKEANDCHDDYRSVLRARLGVIENVQEQFSTPFYVILVFWLVVIFASFGLIAPPHRLSMISVALCALSLSSAIFVILDLDRPYGGLFSISSDSMRTALASMTRLRP